MKDFLRVKCIMSWIVKRIQEDDFGCEERPDDAKVKVLVTLAGSWPEGEIIDGRSIVAFGDGRSAKD